MTDATILDPMLAMFVLTAAVWVFLYARRLPAMRKAGVPVQEYTTPDRGAGFLPESVGYPAHNLRNLFEMPVLFYALCLYLFVTGTAQATDVAAAWVFTGFRIVHSAIHCTVNVVMLRFLAYFVSTLALLFMIGRAVANAGWF